MLKIQTSGKALFNLLDIHVFKKHQLFMKVVANKERKINLYSFEKLMIYNDLYELIF